jgi:hypothetical protein
LSSAGQFTLAWHTITDGEGALGGVWTIQVDDKETTALDAYAAASDVRAALAEIVPVSAVTATVMERKQGIVYDVTFDPVAGDLPQLSVSVGNLTGHNIVSDTATMHNGTLVPGGSFKLFLGSFQTRDIVHDAPARDVGAALEDLQVLTGPVHVRKPANTDTWLITFAPSDGDVAQIGLNSTGLFGYEEPFLATEVEGDFIPLNGTFSFTYLGALSDRLMIVNGELPSAAEVSTAHVACIKIVAPTYSPLFLLG